MLPHSHKSRDDIVKLRSDITSLISELHNVKKELNVLLDQEFITENNIEMLEYITNRTSKVKYILGCIQDYDQYKLIENKYPIQSFTPERTYRRDLSYSLFHRSFSKECYTLDLDFLELRKNGDGINVPVLLYDVKRNVYLNDDLKKWNNGLISSLQAYKDVADVLSIPLWFVNYKPDMSQLTVSNIYSIEPLDIDTVEYTPNMYRKEIESLKP